MSSQMTSILVDTPKSIDLCLADISPIISPQPTKLAIDLEGVDLCRHGRISIIQIVAETSNTIWLLDVTILGNTVFDHENVHGQSLRGVLQNPDTIKVRLRCFSLSTFLTPRDTQIFFDVRNDADALWNAYQIDLANVYDVQLLDVASRRSRNITTRFINGLARCIELYLNPPNEWKTVKEAGHALFSPKKGGSFAIFEQRPLDARILAYCAQDVALLFQLEAAIKGRMGISGSGWEERIMHCSASRVAEAKRPYYDGPANGKHRAIAPIF